MTRNPVSTSERLLLRVEEAAGIAGISRSHAYQLLNVGEWPAIRMGRSVRIPRNWLEKWIEGQVAEWEGAH